MHWCPSNNGVYESSWIINTHITGGYQCDTRCYQPIKSKPWWNYACSFRSFRACEVRSRTLALHCLVSARIWLSWQRWFLVSVRWVEQWQTISQMGMLPREMQSVSLFCQQRNEFQLSINSGIQRSVFEIWPSIRCSQWWLSQNLMNGQFEGTRCLEEDQGFL